MADQCPHCHTHNNFRGRFCSNCGFDLEEGRPMERNFLTTVLIGIAAIGVLLLIIEALLFTTNAYEILNLVSGTSTFYIFIPGPYPILTISGVYLQAYWALVVLSILFSAAYMIIKFVLSFSERSTVKTENTGAFWTFNTAFLSMTLYFIITTFVIILELEGVSSPFEEYNVLEMIYLLAEASFWEEISMRVLLIGVPIMIISLAVNRKASALKSILGGSGICTVSIVLIFISAVVFGIAHSGWEQDWKILDTALAGLLYGYVFVRFGLYASILSHFLTNFSSAFALLGYEMFGNVIFYIMIFAGFLMLSFILSKVNGIMERTNALPTFSDANVRMKQESEP